MGNLSFDYECSARDTTNRATPFGTDTPPKKTKSWEWDESPDSSYEQIKKVPLERSEFLRMQEVRVFRTYPWESKTKCLLPMAYSSSDSVEIRFNPNCSRSF